VQQGEAEEGGEGMSSTTILAITCLILVLLNMNVNRTLNKHETAICELLKLHPELLEGEDDYTE